MKIALSFCIPTYNRVDKIPTAIRSIIEAINNYRDNFNFIFEIIIADNNSTDNTKDAVAKNIKLFQRENICFKYIKNEFNIGASQNLINLPNYSNAEYIWFLSDDDFIIETAVADFFKIFVKNYSFIYVSRLLADKELNVSMGTIAQPKMSKYNPEFKSGFEMIKIMGLDIISILGFFSSIIIKRELWIKTCFISNNSGEFLYLKILLSAIRTEKCYIIENPGVLCRLDYRGFNGMDSFVWLDSYINTFIYAHKLGYDELRCKEMIRSILVSFGKYFVISKAHGQRKGNLFQFLKSSLWYRENYFDFWFLLSVLPRFLLNPIYLCFLTVMKIRKSIW